MTPIKKSLILFVIYTIFTSCIFKSEVEKEDLDYLKTKEILSQLLSETEDPTSEITCIRDKYNFLDDMPHYNIFSELFKELNIKDSLHLQEQIDLLKTFEITDNLDLNKTIIDFDEFPKSDNEAKKFWNTLFSNCDKGYLSISKPIFNEAYNKAFVVIEEICGRNCTSVSGVIYTLQDGKWQYLKMILFGLS